MTLSPQIRDRVQDSFARQGMMATLGARLVDLGPGLCRIAAPITPAVSQQHGFAHAGLAFALGDSAAGYAALTLMPPGAEVLTVEMKINLLRPAAGVDLVASGQVLRAGARLTVVRAEVQARAGDGTERLVAVLQGTMIPADAG
ncbi:MAG: PaaI family thioesterase [Rhodobacterales bacterium]|nr:PaaI family thioesterase [Rhodobacterales bacterium]